VKHLSFQLNSGPTYLCAKCYAFMDYIFSLHGLGSLRGYVFLKKIGFKGFF
jgi:hypothetical protein